MLEQWVRTVFDRVYPGLLARLEAMGPGRFVFDKQRGKDVVRGALVHFTIAARYVFDGAPTVVVRIASSFRANAAGQAQRYHYAFHCGPNAADVKHTYFRVDDNPTQGPHLHLPQSEKHIPFSEIDPDPTGMEPDRFLDLVEEFRRKVLDGASPYSVLPFRKRSAV